MKNKLIKIFSVIAIIIMVASATVLPTLADAPDALFEYDVIANLEAPDWEYFSAYAPPCFTFEYGYLTSNVGERPGSFLLTVADYYDYSGQFYQVDLSLRGSNVPDASIEWHASGYYGTAFSISSNRLISVDGNVLATFDSLHGLHLTYWIDINSLNMYYMAYSGDPSSCVAVGCVNLLDYSDMSEYYEVEFINLRVDYDQQRTGTLQIVDLCVRQLPNAYSMTFSAFDDLFNGYSNGFSEGYDEGYDVGYDWGYEVGHGDGYESGSEDGYQNGYKNGETMGYINGYEQGEMDGSDRGYADGFTNGWQEGFEESVYNFANGYDKGFAEGKTEGYKDGYSATMDVDTAYANGYTDGYETAYKENYEETVNKISPNEGTLTQGFLAGMWNGTQNFVQEILDGVTFSGLSLRSIVTTVFSIALAAFLVRLLRG